MENRKLYWKVLPGVALILLAMSLCLGVCNADAQTAGPGLEATYYNNKDLTAPKLSRTDGQIDFSWGKRSPSRRKAPDTFSARWITGNLGLLTREPAAADRLLPTDGSPATFWVTNPDNVVSNNVAAGSQGNGFWYALPEHPTGLSANAGI